MNNKDIPEAEINERVAVAGKIDTARYWDGFNPLTNHNQYHELMTPDMEAKVNDVLLVWLTRTDSTDEIVGDWMWWHNPEYKANPRLWKLRAYCEVKTQGK